MKTCLAGGGRSDREVGVYDRCWLKVRVFGKEKAKAKHQRDAFSENKRDICLGRAVVRLRKVEQTKSYRRWFVRLKNKRWEGNIPRRGGPAGVCLDQRSMGRNRPEWSFPPARWTDSGRQGGCDCMRGIEDGGTEAGRRTS